MNRIAPVLIFAVVLAIAPVTAPDIPARVIDYVRPEPQEEATLVAVGDMMLSRVVAKRMWERGFDYPFASTSAFIQEADIAFGNLETSITPGPEVQPFEMSFRADPEAALALKDAGFDVLSLANNHTPNFGREGLADTLRYLDEQGIAHVGAGMDGAEAGGPAFITVKGIAFAFLAYNDHDVVPASYEARIDHAGTALMDIEAMTAAVHAAQQYADIIIVSMHAGNEYKPAPNDSQTAFAHAAIDAGAEMVIGHHPHVVQTAEVYRGKYIFYSLGNFVFDQMWSQETREGLVLKATFTKTGLSSLSYHPVLIEDYAQPRFLEPEEALGVTERLGGAIPEPVDRAI